MNLEDLLILVRCKRFSAAAADIKRTVLQKHEALLIIYEIANAVMHKQILSDDERSDFISLLQQYKNRTSHLIHNYLDKETVKYYNCMHFIVKYLVSNCLAELLDLRELILLHPEQLKNESASIYYTATYNLIFKHSLESPKQLTHTQIVQLIALQSEMRLACKSDDFAWNISASFANLCNANIHPQLQLDCLQDILSIGYLSDNINPRTFYSAIINALQYICVSAKKAAYKIDFSVIVALLNHTASIKCEISATIIHILTIASLEDVNLILPQLKIALILIKRNIDDAKLTSDIYLFIVALMQTWIINSENIKHISECITDLMAIVKMARKHFVLNMTVCRCCSGKIDLTSNLQLFSAVVELLKCSGNIGYLIELYEPMCYIATELMMELKSAKCQQFDKHWSKCSALLNSLGAAMLMLTDTRADEGIKFLLLLMKQIGKFGFSANFPKGTLYFIHNLVDFFKQRKDYKNAVIYSAIAMYIDTNNIEKILPIYSQVLYSFNLIAAEGKRLYSIINVLNANMNVAREYITKNIDKNRMEELFRFELNFYINKWQSRTYMMNLVKQMAKFGLITLITSTIRDYYTLFVNLDYDMIAVLKNLLKNERNNLNSALLNYLIAHNITYNLIQTNQIDMNNTAVPQKVTYSYTEPIPDPNDTCDIVSSYSSLSLNNHKLIITYLKCALYDIEQSYDAEDAIELARAFELCSKLAHSFRLHCNFLCSESAWMLAKKIAAKLDDNAKLLEAIGWLLDKADSNETTLRLLKVGDVIATTKQSSIVENNLCLSWYHLHICNFHLKNCRWDLAKKEYIITRDLTKFGIEEEDQTGFAIHFAFLKSTISRMPCDMALIKNPHKPELLPKDALKMLISFINKIGYMKVEAFHLTAYFEELDDVLMRLSLMRLPRELRLYGKDVVTLAQKLVLSIRTARILTHLARADVLTCKITDCHVKLDGIADILNLPVMKPKNAECTIKDTLIAEDYKDIIDCKLVDQIREMQLNVPQCSSMSGSPIFNKRFYNIPNFINHSKNCDCFECSTPEYAILILSKLHIDFLLNESEPDYTSISDVIYDMAAKVYNFLITRENIFISIDYKKVYNETYTYFLMDYTLKFGMIKDNLNIVKDINKQVIDLLKENNKYDSDILICEANMQRSLILMHEKSLNNNKTLDNNESYECKMHGEQTIDKTPENNYLSKSVEDKLLLSTLIIERRRKNIPFHLSDDEEEVKLKPAQENKSPKFMIFDDNLKSAHKSPARKKIQSVLNTAFRHPTASCKVKERTAKKTKILTDKLKTSARKRDDDNCAEAGGFSKPIRTGRKNLLQELNECEQTPKLSAKMKVSEDLVLSGVRRSSRKK